jgi:hypothetical protein
LYKIARTQQAGDLALIKAFNCYAVNTATGHINWLPGVAGLLLCCVLPAGRGYRPSTRYLSVIYRVV